MANTRDVIGEQATLDAIISRTITSFEDDKINTLKTSAFSYCSALTSIKMPNLTRCGDGAFSSTQIKNINGEDLPNLSYSSSSLFYNNTSLEKAHFNSLSRIGALDFSGCKHLMELILLNENGVTNTGNSFNTSPIAAGFGVIYLPRSKVQNYKSISTWKPYFIAAYEDYPVTPEGSIADSWSEILAAESDGSYLTKYNIGDTKIQKIGDYLFKFEIVGFDKDNLADGSGKAHISWLARNSFLTGRIIASSDPSNRWATCELRSTLRAMLDSSDDEFKNAVKEVLKDNIADTIWIPSKDEVIYNSAANSVSYTDIFTNNTSRKRFNQCNESIIWHLRNLYDASSQRWYNISASGGSSYGSGTIAHYIIPGFCT